MLLAEPEHIACASNPDGSQDCAAVVSVDGSVIIKRFHCEASADGKTQWCAATTRAARTLKLEDF